MPKAAANPSSAQAEPPADPGVRRRIVEGARRHFFAHGFRSVTMDDLAIEMRMSKKTLYVHFPSKTALLRAVLEDKLARAGADLQAATAHADFARQLESLLACLREHGEEIQPPFVRDMQREAPELFATVQAGRAQLIRQHFGSLLAAGQKSGRIRKDVGVEFLTGMLIGAVNEVVHPARLSEFGLTPKAAFVKAISIFLDGVRTEKGRVAP